MTYASRRPEAPPPPGRTPGAHPSGQCSFCSTNEPREIVFWSGFPRPKRLIRPRARCESRLFTANTTREGGGGRIEEKGRGRPSHARGSRGSGGGDLCPGSGHVPVLVTRPLARLVTCPVRLTSWRSYWREDSCSSGKVTAETRMSEAPSHVANAPRPAPLGPPLGQRQRHVLPGLDARSGPQEPEERCASPRGGEAARERGWGEVGTPVRSKGSFKCLFPVGTSICV